MSAINVSNKNAKYKLRRQDCKVSVLARRLLTLCGDLSQSETSDRHARSLFGRKSLLHTALEVPDFVAKAGMVNPGLWL
jgi:hypothetical protein